MMRRSSFVWGFVVLLGLVSGCASLTSPDNEVRVTEYGADGSYLAQASGQVAGCRAVQQGKVDGCLKFKGTTCSFTSTGCEAAAPR